MEENFKKYPELESKLISKCRGYGVNINLKNPKTIQDKINWMKLYDSTPLKTKCADKIQVHDYCKEKLGKDICIPLIGTYKSTSEINWEKLPEKFVIKCNHGSGMNIIVRNKKTADKIAIYNKINRWLKQDFSQSICLEMHYHNIPHRILIEEYKEDAAQKTSLMDYKVWCFNGTPKFIQTICDRTAHKYSNHYDTNWNYIEMYRSDLKSDKTKLCEKPKNLEKMLEYAEILSKDFKFVRVDFYEINGILYLGELTFTPGAGIIKYQKTEQAIKIGELLKLK